MGYVKNRHERQSTLGYNYDGDKYVCSNCFSDYAIQNFIKNNASEIICSYCGTRKEEPIAADLDDVLGFIMKGILSEYSDPDDEGMSYDSDEGGYQGEIYQTSEIFEDEIERFIEDENLSKDISDALIDKEWCRKDFYFLPKHEKLIINWDRFSKQVKYKTRYVFFRLPGKSSDVDIDDPDEIPISEMLDHFGRILSETRLLRILKPGDIFFRARIHLRDKVCNNVKECGQPLANELFNSNRMSPAGISMFYGALDEQTTLVETHDTGDEKVITISKWESCRALRFLDLMNIPALPSIFDSKNRNMRPNILFLNSFKLEIVRPLVEDKFASVDYVPTQVFTEYIRHLYMDSRGNRYDGILYPSSKHPDHVNAVVFCERQNCLDIGEALNPKSTIPKYIRLISYKDVENKDYNEYLASI